MKCFPIDIVSDKFISFTNKLFLKKLLPIVLIFLVVKPIILLSLSRVSSNNSLLELVI